MNNNPIHLREQGQIIQPSVFESILPQNSWSLTSILNNSCPGIVSSQKVKFIWIRGQDNFLITLEAHGNAVLLSIFPTINPVILNKPNERVQKMALTESFLCYIVKVNNSDSIKFFIVPIENLNNFTPVRTQVLQQLTARSEEIEEIESEGKLVVVKKNDFFQVWSIEESKLLHLVSVAGSLYSKYSRGSVIACYQNNSTLIILIHNLKSNTRSTLHISEGSNPYHCELINSSLILGMLKRELVIIDLISNKITSVGACKRFYEFEDYPDSFVLLHDNTGIFISNPELKINCGVIGRIFQNNGKKLIVYSKEKNSVMIIDPSGSIDSVKLERNLKVQVLGFSNNTSSFYCADKKGLISVFE